MKAASASDYREIARRRLPHFLFEYIDGGSYDEATLTANRADLKQVTLRQRVLRDVSKIDLSTTLFGQKMNMPVALAPIGLAGLTARRGEVQAARAAEAAGVPFTLSTVSACDLAEVVRGVKQPFWFQLYMMRDRDAMVRMIERAKAAKCSALVLTLDLQVIGQRHKDLKNGLTAPPRPTLANIINLMTKPRWCLGMLGTRRHTFGNLVGHVKEVSDMKSLSSWTNEQFDPRVSWPDVKWVKEQWGGKLILKGIQDVEDAKLAVESGADAIVVSNHGGRQLDGAETSIRALPAIVAAVGDKIEVHMDGGVRSGQDVLRAWALGAKGVWIGRAMAYGLGAMGEAGVTKALQIIHKELDVSMAFCGHTNIQNVDKQILLPGTYPTP